jgi:hypothetical protein
MAMNKRKDCPYQMRRAKLVDAYLYKLVDVTTEQVIASGITKNPVVAPQYLRRVQASLNTRYVLDKLRVMP